MTSKQIARELGISPSTVDNHIRAVVDRLGAANRIEAARMVILAGEGPNDEKLSPEDNSKAQRVSTEFTPFRLWHLPPLGGEPNTLGTVARFAHVAQIALLGTMVFAAITATIAGIVNLFR